MHQKAVLDQNYVIQIPDVAGSYDTTQNFLNLTKLSSMVKYSSYKKEKKTQTNKKTQQIYSFYLFNSKKHNVRYSLQVFLSGLLLFIKQVCKIHVRNHKMSQLLILNCHEGGHPLPGEPSEAVFAFNDASAQQNNSLLVTPRTTHSLFLLLCFCLPLLRAYQIRPFSSRWRILHYIYHYSN